jgi:acyl carrier protein
MIGQPEIEAHLLAFVRKEIFAPDLVLTSETDLLAEGFDSMSLVRVLLFIEQTFGMWIPSSEINADTLRNIRALSVLVARLLHER